ncbi:TPA: restriction endonuclease subunit S [Salmonella enterica subsp. diarizonae serovar 60-67:z35:-]
MSGLNYLEKLLDGAGVEWKRLGDVARIKNGKDHKSLGEGSFPVYGSGGIMRFVDTYAYNKPSVLIPRKGSLGNLFFVDVPFWTVDTIFYTEIDEVQISPKYFYYFLTTVGLGEMNQAGGVPSQTQSVLNKLKIPIPCPENPAKSLAIQSEIVRILDAFSALTNELTNELKLRRKQYNYYRDKLLSFDTERVPYLPMGQKDIGEFIRGGTFQKKDFMDTGVGCIHYGQIYTYYGIYTKKTKTHISAELAKKCKKAKKGDLIIATTSENDEDVCKSVAWLGNEDIAVSSDACIYKHNLNPKYVSYFFQTEQFQNQKRQYITGAKVRRVNADNLSKILIPVPSMEVQERIASILDKFDALTNSITDGLPREIELRKKQYEYYRDLLFSFPKPPHADI